MERAYKKQVSLLLNVLPEVAKESCFALHGGTAINLFVQDMPRLSVDIDLTYIPVEDRAASLRHISEALARIKANIEKVIPGVRVLHKTEAAKLQVSAGGVDIKLEVNLVGRGLIDDPVQMPLCRRAQEEFDVFCTMPIVPIGQLYGGKICAALDRQHPRDLFDIKYFLKSEGFSDPIKRGFIYCLLGSDRPIHEVIGPNFQDQRMAMTNQFAGMSSEAFTYEEYEIVRMNLVMALQHSLTQQDKEFLLSIKKLEPDWALYDFQQFPSIGWKLQNLKKLKDGNPDKHLALYKALKVKLGNF